MNENPKETKSEGDLRYRRYYQGWLWPGSIFMLILGWSLVDLEISPQLFWEGIPHFFNLVREMFPPNWAVLAGKEIPWSILETLSMAFVGTFLGAVCSFFLALFAARNLAPSGVVREMAKGLMAAERAVPTLIIILLLVVVIGFGPFAGMIAIAVGSIGMLGKLFAEAIEEVDPRPLEALTAVGATKSQIIRYAVLPQVLPSLIANSLYRFDINLRVALFLGVVGAGGIGFDLYLAMKLFKYADA
ncbi:phosphonate ABC transporter, permease protein PhnE, partial [candidate division NPL-UPA2 bacterium]|nr:phosphonate ABC transporter, permease protein PhnE [candidate division NPL-UPA2 bacterium]